MQNSVKTDYCTSESWTILNSVEKSIKRKIEEIGTPLKEWNISINYGVKTGLNEAFIISKETKDALIKSDPKSAEIIRPILRGRDIKRYSYKFADLWIILAGFGSHEYLETEYPAIYKHLLQYKEQLSNRGQCRYTSSGKVNTLKDYPGQHHWLELDNNPSKEYLDDFSKQKIVYREISNSMDACMVEPDIYLNNKCYILTGEHLEYLICIFNSRLFNKIILSNANLTGGKGCGFLGNVKIPYPNEDTNKKFTILYEELQTASTQDRDTVEEAIENSVCDLYDITGEERKEINSIV